ncbi:MAG: hypothetical protein ACD_17C00271G0002 [uncultured bacterium]|nr:MAG: hypothetical protein ACD_17C00271G0002 [uncultured bacterium]OGN56894.1 MAG: hypothetical protein A2796_06920 [Chlamydiae bacterium RIFCSPHIGHO2_01_FULL_44_39]OGN59552.1 MAG: hypothetical protein A3D96_07610 [Chlamydiae bacterium RIFCSPHIGHO2_12_FULL_44_59]OGN67298.1 MAG: hypothetical protein A2978_03440 [Chlamydiae bacterium RIFCSPLOWO2_01_FULL_44_52]OGN68718.1 MAG: hypothetical protein A3I67_03170 [Chlamydiae bacterium RIFCSPLOWO2_02_FULL_45_22]OGN69240.1 MAG: hypothetical protein A3
MSHRGWIVFSGYLWFFIGSFLLYKGLVFITSAAFESGSTCARLSQVFGSQDRAATALIGMSLLAGFFKGRFVLVKTVKRVIKRLLTFEGTIQIKDAYAPSYWALIGMMVLLGMAVKYLPIPMLVRGMVDVTVGSALINGALIYFKAARTADLFSS